MVKFVREVPSGDGWQMGPYRFFPSPNGGLIMEVSGVSYNIPFGETGKISWRGGFTCTLDGSANTADRTYTLPDANGTIALTANPTFTGLSATGGLTSTGPTTINASGTQPTTIGNGSSTTTVGGPLAVNGTTTMTGGLVANGGVTASATTASTSTTTGALVVTGGLGVGENLFVGNNTQTQRAFKFSANNRNGTTSRPVAIEILSTDGGTNSANVYGGIRYGSGKFVVLAAFDPDGNAISASTATSANSTFVFCVTNAATNFP